MKLVASLSETSQSVSELFDIALEVLGDVDCESIPINGVDSFESGHFKCWRDGRYLFGSVSVPIDESNLESVSYALYSELFDLIGYEFLYRIWNYIPRINEGLEDQERYKLFCKGRSEAFHEKFGEHEETFMPAGSCVGIDGDRLVVYFLAGDALPAHHENPNQVPAYRYPREYGVKSPSFARATSLLIDGRFMRFISGTAAVIGHASLGVGDLDKQLEITCDNLELVAGEASAATDRRLDSEEFVSGKVYLRNAADFSRSKAYLDKRLSAWAKNLIYVRSDICRKELLVEIELTFEQAIS